MFHEPERRLSGGSCEDQSSIYGDSSKAQMMCIFFVKRLRNPHAVQRKMKSEAGGEEHEHRLRDALRTARVNVAPLN